MELKLRKEEFSKAFARAIAAVAGCNTYQTEQDIDSVDIGFSGTAKSGMPHAQHLEAQVKCTAVINIKNSMVYFRLKRKNYEGLRKRVSIPRILIVMRVPRDIRKWISLSDESSLIQH